MHDRRDWWFRPWGMLFAIAIAEGGEEIPERKRAEIGDRIAELRRELGVARLAVLTTPPGATLSISGIAVGVTPFEGDVFAGTHSVVLTLEGYEPAERSLALGAAETRTLEVVLAPLAERPPAEMEAVLDATSDPPGVVVSVDGREVGTTPVHGARMAAGEHVVRVAAGADRFWEDRVTAGGGETVRVDVSLPGGGLSQAWFWTALGATAAAGAGMAATGAYAYSLHDEYVGATPERLNEIRPTGELMQDLADAFLGVTGVAAAAALVPVFLTEFGDAEAAAQVEVVPLSLQGADEAAAARFGIGVAGL